MITKPRYTRLEVFMIYLVVLFLILGVLFVPQGSAGAVTYCTVPAGSNLYQKSNSVAAFAATTVDMVFQNKGDALGRTLILADPTGPEITQMWTDEASCPDPE